MKIILQLYNTRQYLVQINLCFYEFLLYYVFLKPEFLKKPIPHCPRPPDTLSLITPISYYLF